MSRVVLLGGEGLFAKDDAAILAGPLASFSWFAVALSGAVFFRGIGLSPLDILALSLSCALFGTALAWGARAVARRYGTLHTQRIFEAALIVAVPAELLLYAVSVALG